MSHAEPEPPAPTAAAEPSTGRPGSEARKWAVACHLAGLAGYLGIPFASIIGPLVIWLLKREDHALVDEQGKEAVNFQISVTLYSLAALVLVVVLIGIPLLLGITIGHFVVTIVAAIKTANGHPYRYPLSLRLIA